MPEEVAFFVAKNVRSNVRELEGALRQILAYSRFNQKEISIALAREALRDLLSIQNRQISVENIQKMVADYYKIRKVRHPRRGSAPSSAIRRGRESRSRGGVGNAVANLHEYLLAWRSMSSAWPCTSAAPVARGRMRQPFSLMAEVRLERGRWPCKRHKTPG